MPLKYVNSLVITELKSSDEFETAPSKALCFKQLFYGYKLHGVCSVTGVSFIH
jgi:hypothetical protein